MCTCLKICVYRLEIGLCKFVNKSIKYQSIICSFIYIYIYIYKQSTCTKTKKKKIINL